MNGELIRGMPYEIYEGIAAVRVSWINRLADSAAHLKWHLEHEDKDSSALRVGSATDCAILTPDRLHLEFCCGPDVKRNTKEGKALWEQFTSENEGKTILKADEWDLAINMATSISKSETASTLIKQAQTQVVITWTDSETEVKCKARLDGWVPSLNTAFDLKTTRDVRNFQKSIVNYGYSRQAAWYLTALKEVGLTPEHFLFLAIDKDPPHCNLTFRLLDEVVELGRKSNRELLHKYAVCVRKKSWPGYTDNVIDIGLTDWQKAQAFNIA